MRNLTSLDYELSVVIDRYATSSASMSRDINQLAINDTAYFHIAGLTDFDDIQRETNTTGIMSYNYMYQNNITYNYIL